MERTLRTCWQNCFRLDDPRFLADVELATIDAMEDALGPLDETVTRLRAWITRFEACYVEAAREAERIIQAIGRGVCPEPILERPAARREELASSEWILSAWCEDPEVCGLETRVGDIAAMDLLGYLGESTPLKRWQVARIVDRVTHALNPNHPYFSLALDPSRAEKHYQEDLDLLLKTRKTLIHDSLNGQSAEISLAYAMDLMMPCHWDFVGNLMILLQAIGGDLYPPQPYTCCARNLYLSPQCHRLRIIASTLQMYGSTPSLDEHDPMLLASLGSPTDLKRWLAASLSKTIRLHLETPFSEELT